MPDFKERACAIIETIKRCGGWRQEGTPDELRFEAKEFDSAFIPFISAALSQAYEEGVRAERERIGLVVEGVMNECSKRMHKHFEREQDRSAEVFRMRLEGAARVAQKLGMLEPVDDEANTQSPDEEPQRGDTGTAEQREANEETMK